MKRLLTFIAGLIVSQLAVADNYSVFKSAKDLLDAGQPSEAKNKFLAIQEIHYPDIPPEAIREALNECERQIALEQERRLKIAQAQKEAYDRRKRNNLVYISIAEEINNENGGSKNIRDKIITALEPYDLNFTENKSAACWSICLTTNITNIPESETNDPNMKWVHLYSIYTVRNELNYTIPRGGEKAILVKGYASNIIEAQNDAYNTLNKELGDCLYEAISDIHRSHNNDNNNDNKTIAIITTGNITAPFINAFKKGLHNSGYFISDLNEERIQIRNKLITYGELYNQTTNQSLKKQEIVLPQYICDLEYQQYNNTDYYSVTLTNIGSISSEVNASFSYIPNTIIEDILGYPAIMENAANHLLIDLDNGMSILNNTEKDRIKNANSAFTTMKDNLLKQHNEETKEKAKQDSIKDEILKQQRKQADIEALRASALVPGLGLIQKGHKREGISYLAGEGVLVAGIITTQGMRIVNIKKMRGTTKANSKRAYTNNANSFTTARNVCIGSAILLYGLNLLRSYTADLTQNCKLEWKILITPHLDSSSNSYHSFYDNGSSIDFGLAPNISLVYSF